MLSQPPPELHIPKYVSSTAANFLTRPKLTAATFGEEDISRFRSSSPVVLDSDFSAQASYHYGDCGPQSFDSPISPSDMYEGHPLSDSYTYSSNHYATATAPGMTTSRTTRSFMDGSSSPEEIHPSSLPQSTFYHSSDEPFNPNAGNIPRSYSRDSVVEACSAGNASHPQNSYLDQRRMSEPAVLGPQNSYVAGSTATTTTPTSDLNQSFGYNPQTDDTPRASAFVPSLHRGVSMGSLRDPRSQWLYSSPPRPDYARIWREKHEETGRNYVSEDGFDGPISPLQADFSGGMPFPSTGIDHYGPSPPNTGTSTSSAPLLSPTSPTFQHDDLAPPKDPSGKTYAFVALPGNSVKKRPRRRYDEIERLYRCSWPDCTKSYGTLNHLNAHVTMQKHGSKRSPSEFKEMRKQWRKQKKDQEGPAPPATRRENLGDGSSGRYEHNGRHAPPSGYSRQATQFGALPVPMANSGNGGRYGITPPTLYRSSSGRDSELSVHGPQLRHRAELGGTPASWHATSSRTNTFDDYMASSLPSNNFSHHGMSNRELAGHLSVRPASPSTTSNLSRLPPDSTLLTPLPGFHHQESIPHLMQVKLGYEYDIFHEDNTGRPGSGHRNAGHSGGDEY